jgi:hypothetical protein
LDIATLTPAVQSTWWQRAIGRSGGTAGVTFRNPRELGSQPDPTPDNLPPPSPSPPLSRVPTLVGGPARLPSSSQRAEIAEAVARIVSAEQAASLGRRMTAENHLAARDLRDILSQHSRSTSPASPLAARPPSPFPFVLAGTAVTASTPLDNNGLASVEQSSRESDSPADHGREADSGHGGSISPGPPAPRRTGLRPDRASRQPTDRDEARLREAREEAPVPPLAWPAPLVCPAGYLVALATEVRSGTALVG